MACCVRHVKLMKYKTLFNGMIIMGITLFDSAFFMLRRRGLCSAFLWVEQGVSEISFRHVCRKDAARLRKEVGRRAELTRQKWGKKMLFVGTVHKKRR